MIDRAELRRLAGAARKFYEKAVYDADESQTWEDFVEYCNPAAIIELLDEIESLKCCWNCANKNNSKHVNTHPECIYRVGKCEKWQGVK